MKDEYFDLVQVKKGLSATSILAIVLIIALLSSALTYFLVKNTDSGGELWQNQTATPTNKPNVDVNGDNSTAFTNVYNNNCNSIVIINSYVLHQNEYVPKALSSGFIFTKDGYAFTNSHCVKDVDKITVGLYNGSELDAQIIGYDERTEVAVIKIADDNEFVPTTLGDSDKVSIGEYAIAIGSPLGFEYSLSVGVVSGLERSVNANVYRYKMLQVDTALNEGNSGGPLFNIKGEVIGINTMKSSSLEGASVEGIGFAIPINIAKDIGEQLVKNGKVIRAALQATVGTATNGNDSGVYIDELVAGGAAELAGLKEYDVIVAFNDTPITSISDLLVMLEGFAPGDEITLTVIRNDIGTLKIPVKLGST